MKRILSPVGLGISAAILSVLVVGIFFGIKAVAISSHGPDTTGGAGESYGGANIYYELSNTPDVVATSLVIPVYYDSNPGSVQVVVNCAPGVISPMVGSNSICSTGHFTVSGFSQDASSGLYAATVTITLGGGQSANNYRAFRLTAPGGVIGYSHNNSSHFALANIDRCDSGGITTGCNKYFNYKLPFAGACNVGSGSQVIDIYDADNTGTGNQYNIQPTKFQVQIKDTTTGGNVGYALSGSYGSNSNAALRFNYTQYHKYQLLLNGVYSNNVLQFHLPFDSIYAETGCPSGGITSSVTASCSEVAGYTYNLANRADNMAYYVYVNPPAGTPTTYYAGGTPSATAGFRGPGTANQPNPPGTPGSVPSNHGFDSPVHITSGSGTGKGLEEYNFKGDYATNVYWVYARGGGTTNITRIAALTVPAGTCAHTACNASMTDFDGKNGVGGPIKFRVWYQLIGSSSLPPGATTFTVSVAGPTGTTTITPAPAATASGGYAYSDYMNYTPTQPGNYTVTWSYYGQPSCSTAPILIGFNPYFDVEGGDITAGAGFGESSCTQTSADIASWNYDNSPTTGYYGAGSQMAAIASGTLRSFVSGLKPAANTTNPASRTGTDSLNFVGTPTALSFANAGSGVNTTSGHYGGAFTSGGGQLPCITDYASQVTTGAPWSGNYGTSGIYIANGTTVIGTGGVTLPHDTVIKLKVNGDVYINGDINYDDSAGPLHYPRLSVIATGNIYVAGSHLVHTIHGLYVAQSTASGQGKFATCATMSGGVITETTDYDTCNDPLTIYGSVAANKLNLERTANTLASSGGPAESFRYTPEFWLATPECTAIPSSAQCNQPSAKGQKTDAIISLPPVL